MVLAVQRTERRQVQARAPAPQSTIPNRSWHRTYRPREERERTRVSIEMAHHRLLDPVDLRGCAPGDS